LLIVNIFEYKLLILLGEPIPLGYLNGIKLSTPVTQEAYQCPVCDAFFENLTNQQQHCGLHLPSRLAGRATHPGTWPCWGDGYLDHRQPCQPAMDAIQLCSQLVEELLAICLPYSADI
jgi:hypothetical protein